MTTDYEHGQLDMRERCAELCDEVGYTACADSGALEGGDLKFAHGVEHAAGHISGAIRALPLTAPATEAGGLGSELINIVKAWIKEYQPSCEESFYQMDRVILALPELGAAIFRCMALSAAPDDEPGLLPEEEVYDLDFFKPIGTRTVTIEITGTDKAKPLICDDDTPPVTDGGLRAGVEAVTALLAEHDALVIYRDDKSTVDLEERWNTVEVECDAVVAALAHAAPEPDTLRERVERLAGEIDATANCGPGECNECDSYRHIAAELRALLQPPSGGEGG